MIKEKKEKEKKMKNDLASLYIYWKIEFVTDIFLAGKYGWYFQVCIFEILIRKGVRREISILILVYK